MGKCASKQQLHHRELLHQQYNWNDKSNGRTVNGKNTRSSISEQSIFLLIENEVIPFYQVVSYCSIAIVYLFCCVNVYVRVGMVSKRTNWMNKERERISMKSSFFNEWNDARSVLVLSSMCLYSISLVVYNLALITKTSKQNWCSSINEIYFFLYFFVAFFPFFFFFK